MAGEVNATIDAMMAEANSTIKKVANMLAEDPLYSVYVEFEVNGLSINSTQTDRYSNLVMSLSNKKNGSGEANTFTLVIAYAPTLKSSETFASILEEDNFNVNALEQALAMSSTDYSDPDCLKCTLRYGYANNLELRTVKYEGLLLNYECDFQDGMLIYTLTGYSGLTRFIESKDPIDVSGAESETGASGETLIKPTNAAKYIVENYLEGYKCEFGEINGQSVQSSDEAIVLNTQLDKNPMKALTDILNQAICSSQKEALDGSMTIADANKITYGWTVKDRIEDSNESIPTVFIYAVDPANLKDAKAGITFNWGHSSNDALSSFVISFKPQFNGSSLMALWAMAAKKADKKEDEENMKDSSGNTLDMNGTLFLSNDGSLQVAEETSSPAPSGDVKSVNANIEQLRSTWVSAVQYPYSASMTTAGVPCELPITGLIELNVLIGYNNSLKYRKHHSSGTYMIKSTEDIINQNEFSTTWDLIKVQTAPKVENIQNDQVPSKSSEDNDNPDGNPFTVGGTFLEDYLNKNKDSSKAEDSWFGKFIPNALKGGKSE